MSLSSGGFHRRIGTVCFFGVRSLLATFLVLAQSGCSAEEPAAAADAPLIGWFRCTTSQSLRGAGSIAADRQGNIFVATGPRFRGEGPVSTVRKIDTNGTAIWAYRLPDGDELLPLGMATDASGAVIVVGRSFRTEWLPNGVEQIRASLVLLKLDAAGHLEFRRDFDGSGYFVEIAIAPGGEFVVRGRYSSSLDLGGGPLPDSGGPSTSFIARFGPTGDLLWTKDFGNPDEQAPIGMATDESGAVLVTGRLTSTFDFGGGPLSPTPNSDPESDIPQDAFLVKYDASGHHVWSYRFGGDGTQRFGNIAMNAEGNAIVLGYNNGVMELGGRRFVGDSDIVAGFNPQGEQVFSAALPTTWSNAQRIAVSASGKIYVAGTFSGRLDVEGTRLVSAGGRDLFVLRLDPRGVVEAGAQVGGASDEGLWGLTVGPQDVVRLAGDFRGILNFGCGSVASRPDVDAFVAGFAL